jgi:hypothetical protein
MKQYTTINTHGVLFCQTVVGLLVSYALDASQTIDIPFASESEMLEAFGLSSKEEVTALHFYDYQFS